MESRQYRIFTINPGSTSTKIALFEGERKIFAANVSHAAEELKKFKEIKEQFPYRKETILNELAKNGVVLSGLDAVVGRCGGMGPTTGGAFKVNDLLLMHATGGRATKHPSNLGGILAHDFASSYGGIALIVNPPDTDEFEVIARVSGLAGVERESKNHPLNQKEVAHRYAAGIGKRYEDLNLVISHIGGGVSVAAHRKGRMIDGNNIVDGDGPMAPTRAGAVAAIGVVKMCFSGKYTEREMYDRITKNGGFVDHLGTAEVTEVLRRIKDGDTYAKLIYDAMIYQIGKEIAAYAAVLKGEVDAILLTGGIANDTYLVEEVTKMVSFIAPVKVYPGNCKWRPWQPARSGCFPGRSRRRPTPRSRSGTGSKKASPDGRQGPVNRSGNASRGVGRAARRMTVKAVQTDVVVMGSGGAGLAAAIAAAEGKAKVVLFEKRKVFGGISVTGMGIFAVESRLQRLKNVPYTKDEIFRLFMERTHWMADAKLVRAYIDKTASTIEWLEGMGVQFDSSISTAFRVVSTRRDTS